MPTSIVLRWSEAARSVGKMAEGAGLARVLSAATPEGGRPGPASRGPTDRREDWKQGWGTDGPVKDGAKACRTVLSEGLNRIKNLFD